MSWFKNGKEYEAPKNNRFNELLNEAKEGKHIEFRRNINEERLRLLEISSNCAKPGEPSSITIERAIAFKKYLLS